MACPICDQKPMNCDCTETERRQFAEIAELEEQVASLRLTDEERAAILQACDEGRWYPKDYHYIHTLRSLLSRLS
jgi:hypothetical protein